MTRVRKTTAKQTGSVRIISGQHRGRKLPVLVSEGLRPTADRMKETLFNWLMADIHGAKCLDMFAGAGSLGFEALSRHAQSCLFIEQDRTAAMQLKQNLATLKVSEDVGQIHHGNALAHMQTVSCTFDIVFIDPPFKQQLVQKSIDLLNQHNLLVDGAKIYIEIEREAKIDDLQVPNNWQRLKHQSSRHSQCLLYQV